MLNHGVRQSSVQPLYSHGVMLVSLRGIRRESVTVCSAVPDLANVTGNKNGCRTRDDTSLLIRSELEFSRI